MDNDLYSRGRRQMRLCDLPGYQQAAASFIEARELSPDSAPVHAALAETCAHWGWRREIAGLSCRIHYEDAMTNALRAVELAPASGDAHRAMAAALRRGGRRDPERRRAEALRAWEINPYNGENCLELWRANGRGLDDPLAEQAIALDPSLCAAHIDLGVASTEAGCHHEAVYHLTRALELSPGNSLVQYDLAMVRLREGRAEKAEELLAAACEARPGDPLLEKGLALARRERAGGASS